MGLEYKQYTTCVKAEDYVNFDKYAVVIAQAFGAMLIGTALIGTLIELGLHHPYCWLIVIWIGGLQGILAYCLYELNGRLICLDGDQTAVGLLMEVTTAADKSGFDKWDTDTSIDLLLAKNLEDTPRSVVENSVPYGKLVAEHELTNARDLPFSNDAALLHAEFEGGGVYNLFVGTQAAFALAVIALIACLTLPVWVVVLLVFLSIVSLLIGGVLGLDSTGVPGDVNADLPVLKKRVHILFVAGTWVYDAGHNHAAEPGGWNEIHPIKYCTLLADWEGPDWPDNIDRLIAENLDQYEKTKSPQTRTAQDKPENQWEVHPLIDGCTLSSIS